MYDEFTEYPMTAVPRADCPAFFAGGIVSLPADGKTQEKDEDGGDGGEDIYDEGGDEGSDFPVWDVIM